MFLRGARERLNAASVALAVAFVVLAGVPARASLRVALEFVLARGQLGGAVVGEFADVCVFALDGVADDTQTLFPAFQGVAQRTVRVRVAALGRILGFQRGRGRCGAAPGRRRA